METNCQEKIARYLTLGRNVLTHDMQLPTMCKQLFPADFASFLSLNLNDRMNYLMKRSINEIALQFVITSGTFASFWSLLNYRLAM